MSLRLPKHKALPFIVAGTLAAVALVAVLAPRVLAVIQKSQGAASTNVGHTVRQPFANSNGLVAWYPLDGNAQDASGNGNDGTLTNFTFDGTTNGWTSGVFGNALQFNGSNNYVTIPSNSALSPSNAISVEAWINVPAAVDHRGIVSKYDATGATMSYRLSVDYLSNQLNFSINNVTAITYVATLIPGTWYYVVGTYDRSAVKLYLNGSLVGQSLYTSSINVGTGPVVIGQDYCCGGNSRYWLGSLDDVRIYSRALADYEIYEQYSAGR